MPDYEWSTVGEISQDPKTPRNPYNLTAREIEVAKLIARGDQREEIAKALGFSMRTFDTHRSHILTKTGCRNSVQLTHRLIALGIVEVLP